MRKERKEYVSVLFFSHPIGYEKQERKMQPPQKKNSL
jgi:hypothetical protein